MSSIAINLDIKVDRALELNQIFIEEISQKYYSKLGRQGVKMEFTEQHIKNWGTYEKVRQSGKYNMFSSQARIATGLSRADYIFVMNNYPQLEEANANRTRNN
jgi:hypothetical protein